MKAKIKLYTTIGNAYLTYAKELEGGEVVEAPATTTEEAKPETAAAKKKRLAAEKKAKAAADKAAKTSTKKEDRSYFTKDEPAQTPKELELFHKQWSGMSSEQQEAYLRGEVASNICSIEEKIEAHAESKKAPKEEVEELEELEELDDLDDLEEVKTYTQEEVRAAARTCAKRIGKEETYKILENFGSKKVAEIKAENYAELMQELGA